MANEDKVQDKKSSVLSYLTHPITVLLSLRQTVPEALRESAQMRSFNKQIKKDDLKATRQLDTWNLLKAGIDSAKPMLVGALGSLPMVGAFCGFLGITASTELLSNRALYVRDKVAKKIEINKEKKLAVEYLQSNSTNAETHKVCAPKAANAQAKYLDSTSRSKMHFLSLLVNSTFLFTMNPLSLAMIGAMSAYSSALKLYDLKVLKATKKEAVSAENTFQKDLNGILDADSIIRETNNVSTIEQKIDQEAKKTIQNVDAHYRNTANLENKKMPFFSLSSAILWTSSLMAGAAAGAATGSFVVGGASFAAALMASDEIARSTNQLLQTHAQRVDAFREYTANMSRLDYSRENVRSGQRDMQTSNGRLIMKDVSFTYPETGRGVENVNLSFEKGAVNVIAGESGSGKSTVFALLRHELSATKGGVFIDDVNMDDLTKESINNQIAFVAQKPKFLKGTIAEEMALFNPYLSEDEMKDYLKQAGLEGLSLSTKVFNDDGAPALSGGQMQRVAIARALAKKSPIIMMDEPTKALDPKTQDEVWKTIQSLKKEKTILIVSHEANEVLNADRVVILEHGQITADGNPKDLRQNGNLYLTQMYQHAKKAVRTGEKSLLEHLEALSKVQVSVPAPSFNNSEDTFSVPAPSSDKIGNSVVLSLVGKGQKD